MKLFRECEVCVFTQQMRAAGDINHTRFLESFRNESPIQLSEKAIKNYKTLTSEDLKNDSTWKYAPIVVPGNQERHEINLS